MWWRIIGMQRVDYKLSGNNPVSRVEPVDGVYFCRGCIEIVPVRPSTASRRDPGLGLVPDTGETPASA